MLIVVFGVSYDTANYEMYSKGFLNDLIEQADKDTISKSENMRKTPQDIN